jgi:hypothetical protein
MPKLLNSGMKNGFKPEAGDGFGKDTFGQFFSTQASVSPDDVFAKNLPNFLKSRLTWLDHLPRQLVGINDRDTSSLEQRAGSGFAHSYATG